MKTKLSKDRIEFLRSLLALGLAKTTIRGAAFFAQHDASIVRGLVFTLHFTRLALRFAL